jgi:hypothetical protein
VSDPPPQTFWSCVPLLDTRDDARRHTTDCHADIPHHLLFHFPNDSRLDSSFRAASRLNSLCPPWLTRRRPGRHPGRPHLVKGPQPTLPGLWLPVLKILSFPLLARLTGHVLSGRVKHGHGDRPVIDSTRKSVAGQSRPACLESLAASTCRTVKRQRSNGRDGVFRIPRHPPAPPFSVR